jgi:hypothetical protein
VGVLARRGRRARKSGEVEAVVLVEGELLVTTDEATVTQRDNGGTGASAGSASVDSVVASEVEQGVDKVVLRLQIREVQATRQRRVEVEASLDVGGSSSGSLDLLSLDVLQSSQRKLGSESGRSASRDGQISGITEINVLVGGADGARIGSR